MLDLLENKRQGLFAICDEQCKFPKATDTTLVNKYYTTCGTHDRFAASSTDKARNIFVVRHFAGPVAYHTFGFLEKNLDVIRPEMASLALSSSCWLVSYLREYFRVEDDTAVPVNESSTKTTGGRPTSSKLTSTTKKILTLSGEFRSQLENLMENINTTSPHYIRCLKPNSLNVGDRFDETLIINQLRYGGVLEAVRVSRSGFPNRYSHVQFIARYDFFLTHHQKLSIGLSKNTVDIIDSICEALCTNVLDSATFIPSNDAMSQVNPMLRAGIQCGTNLVFIRGRTFDFLERERLLHHKRMIIKIQTAFRTYSAMTSYRITKLAIVAIQCAGRRAIAIRRVKHMKMHRAAVMIQALLRGRITRKLARLLHTSATSVQARYRGYKTRKETKVIKLKYLGALALQCLYRLKKSKAILRQLRIDSRDVNKVINCPVCM